MGIFATPEVSDDPILRSQVLQHLTPGTSEFLTKRLAGGFRAGPDYLLHEEAAYEAAAKDESSPMLSPEEARNKYGLDGQLTFDYPVRETLAKVLHEHKRRELEVQEVLAHPQSWSRWVGGSAVDIAGNMVNPLNLVTTFMPVVGEAKFLSMASRLTRVGARTAVGVAEGGVAVAVTEPIGHRVANLYGDERDSMENIVGGMIFGAVAHNVFGAMGDASRYLRGKPDPIREYILQKNYEQGKISHEQLLKDSALSLTPRSEQAIVKASAAQIANGEVVTAMEKLSKMDDNALSVRVIDEMNRNGEWSHIISKADFQLTRNEFFNKYPELVKSIEKMVTPEPAELKKLAKRYETPQGDIKKYFEMSEKDLASEVKSLKQDFEIAKRSGGKNVEKLGNRLKFVEEMHQNRQGELRTVTGAAEKSNLVERALRNREAIPSEVLREHPELMERFPEESAYSIDKFEQQKQSFLNELDRRKTQLSREELMNFARDRMKPQVQQYEKILDNVDSVEPIKGSPDLIDANNPKVDIDNELASMEAMNKEAIEQAKSGLTEGQLNSLKKFDEEVSGVKRMQKAYQAAANCVISHLGL